MGVILVVFNNLEPEIGIVFEQVPEGTPGQAHGWRGSCTQCGKPMHFWKQDKAIEDGQQHVDGHVSGEGE